jgi:hypothetical protein
VANIHRTFNPESENTGIPIVDIAATDMEDSELDLWRRSMMNGMRATVGPPYVRIYNDLFESPLWLVVFQTILPGCAMLVSAASIAEVRRRLSRMQITMLQLRRGLPVDRTSIETAPVIICVVEGVTCFAIGVILALGEFGPLYLPYAYNYFFYRAAHGEFFLFDSCFGVNYA